MRLAKKEGHGFSARIDAQKAGTTTANTTAMETIQAVR